VVIGDPPALPAFCCFDDVGVAPALPTAIEDVLGLLTDDPAGPPTQELLPAWLDMFGRLMGRVSLTEARQTGTVAAG